MAKRTLSKATRLQEQCQALSVAISKGATIQVNIRGTYRKLMSVKSEPTGISLLFRDEQDNLCILRAVAPQEIELLVRIESEVAHE